MSCTVLPQPSVGEVFISFTTAVSFDDLLFTSVVGSIVLLTALCFVCLAPFFEVVFVCFGLGLRMVAFEQFSRILRLFLTNYYTASSLSITSSTNTIAHQQSLPLNVVILLLWCIYPISAILSALKTIFCAVIGRKELFCCRRSVARQHSPSDEPISYARQQICSTACAIIFFNCRYQLAPISMNKLLLGSDLIKDLRVMEGLSYSQWRDVVIIALVHLWEMCELPSIYTGSVAIAHLIYLTLYVMLSQSVLLITFRRFEVRRLFAMVTEMRMTNPRDEFSVASGAGSLGERPNYITMLDVDKPMWYQGFYSSPGTVLPYVM
eukprot:GHVQ01028209.1.p1 GENE.GHVQ01028209.1~~GHVQ01028209.1.p1  ORF type:complete len:322 (+),score=33.85 GHVQ01028209.1:2-967(+)